MSWVVAGVMLWLLCCGLLFSLFAAIVHYDVVTVFVLGAINATVYPEARMVAASLYQHPEQWRVDTYGYLVHPRIGKLRIGASIYGLYLDGLYGHWEPNRIERRIIYNAVHWYQHDYVKSLLMREVG